MASKDKLDDKELNVLIYMHNYNKRIIDNDGGAKGAAFRVDGMVFTFSTQAVGKFVRMGLIRRVRENPSVYVIDKAGRTTAQAEMANRSHAAPPPKAAKAKPRKKPAKKATKKRTTKRR